MSLFSLHLSHHLAFIYIRLAPVFSTIHNIVIISQWIFLRRGNGVPSRTQIRIRTRKHLATSLNTLHDKRIGEAVTGIVGNEVLVEIQDVAAESRLSVAVGDERVDFDVAVQTVGEVKGNAADGGAGDGGEWVACWCQYEIRL